MIRRFLILLLLALLALPVQPALADDDDDEDEHVGLVAKLEAGVDPQAVADEAEVELVGAMVASRGLYEFWGDSHDGPKDLEKADGVVYADVLGDAATLRSSARQSSWNNGQSSAAAAEQTRRGQSAARQLDLATAQQLASGAGVVVAVLDTGLSGSPGASVAQGYDLIGDDDDTSEEHMGVDSDADGVVDDAYGHGTHVAGIVSLVAPDVTIMPFRVLDSDGNGNAFVTAEAIDMAVERGADVINLSFGGADEVDALEDAIKAADKADVIVVAAAGNTGDEDKQYPAAHKKVIAVAAADVDTIQLSPSSSRGGWVDVTAPGEEIISTAPGGQLTRWSGTSMAAPFVSGAVALLVELDPEKVDSGKDAIKKLEKGGEKIKDGGRSLNVGRAIGKAA